MMSTQLIFGLILNTTAFGLMGFSNNKLAIKIPGFLQNRFFNILITIAYFSSFIVILLSSEILILKIFIALLMQFLINHIIWGVITGSIAGVKTKRNKN